MKCITKILKEELVMIDFGYNTNPEMIQESYDAASSRFSDLMDGKFNSFNPDSIVSSGNNQLKSGVWDSDIEDSPLALGYKNSAPAVTPKPGRFM